MGKFESTEVRVECPWFEEVVPGLRSYRKTGKSYTRFSCVLKQLPVLPKVGQLVQVKIRSEHKAHVFRVKEIIFIAKSDQGTTAQLSKIALQCDYLYSEKGLLPADLFDADFFDMNEEPDS